VFSRVGLGLAALGRPAYITSGRAGDLPDRGVAGLRTRTFSMLDAARGVRYVDAARSYGLAEEFLAGWLAERGHADVIHVHDPAAADPGPARRPAHPVSGAFPDPDSGLFADAPLPAALSGLRAEGVIIGLSASGPLRWRRRAVSARTRSRWPPRWPSRGHRLCCPALSLAEAPAAYWQERAARPWR
jgi:hypothetical protein